MTSASIVFTERQPIARDVETTLFNVVSALRAAGKERGAEIDWTSLDIDVEGVDDRSYGDDRANVVLSYVEATVVGDLA